MKRFGREQLCGENFVGCENDFIYPKSLLVFRKHQHLPLFAHAVRETWIYRIHNFLTATDISKLNPNTFGPAPATPSVGECSQNRNRRIGQVFLLHYSMVARDFESHEQVSCSHILTCLHGTSNFCVHSYIEYFRKVAPEQSESFLRLYNQLQVVMALYNRSLRIALPCTKLVVIVPTVFAAYAVVRLDHIALFCAV